ncbi:MAG: RIP metalloprotease RseP [Bacteroidia bacterium]
MTGLVMAAQLIAGLAILVTLHELGHYLAARAFGIKVEKFYLFFDAWGVKLFSFKKGDTEYGIGWLPLGGYVKIAGMIDESMDKEAMKQEPQPWEFRSKPAWQRLIVMVAGVTMNVILGILIYWFVTYKYGESQLPISEIKYGLVASPIAEQIGISTGDKIIKVNGKKVKYFSDLLSAEVLMGNAVLTVVKNNNDTTDILVPADFIERFNDDSDSRYVAPRQKFSVDKVVEGSNAERAGLQNGDRILAVENQQIEFFDELQKALQENKGEEVKITLNRNNEVINKTVEVTTEGTIGFAPKMEEMIFENQTYGLGESFTIGADKAFSSLFVTIKGLGKIFKGEVSASKSLHGPIGIAKIYGGEWDWYRFWVITGLLSMVLAFMNILPIPALDGGHVMFLTAEAISGRKPSDNFMEKAQITGMIILLGLMAFAIGNDILKIFS